MEKFKETGKNTYDVFYDGDLVAHVKYHADKETWSWRTIRAFETSTKDGVELIRPGAYQFESSLDAVSDALTILKDYGFPELEQFDLRKHDPKATERWELQEKKAVAVKQASKLLSKFETLEPKPRRSSEEVRVRRVYTRVSASTRGTLKFDV